MKKYLNTLFVTIQHAWLSKDGECVSVIVEDKTLGKIPLHTLQSIICFGNVSCSQYLLGHCAELGISVSWFTEYGKFLASMQGPVRGNILVRKEQYRISDSPDRSLLPAKCMIVGKVVNCRTVLMRRARVVEDAALSDAVETLGGILKQIPETNDLDMLRGLEGQAASVYFANFPKLLNEEVAKSVDFTTRNRRPPMDPVNCLLSFGYSLLAHDVQGALEGVGLDPQAGFLHRDRPGRAGLALDMMEEFRPYLVDRLVLTLLNRRQIQVNDFKREETGAYLLKENARKEFLSSWQERKREEVIHPFLNEKMHVGILCHVQAMLLARWIRGECDAYAPFVMR